MRPRPVSGRALLVQTSAHVPPVLALAAEQADIDIQICSPREGPEALLSAPGILALLSTEPDSLATAVALADARPDGTKVLLADERSLPLAVEVLNACGAIAIGRLDGGVGPLASILARAVARGRELDEDRRLIMALRSALDLARSALAQAEDRVVAVRGSIDVDSGLWDTMRLVERIEDEANRLQRYGTPFGVLSVDCGGREPAFEAAVGTLLTTFVRKVDVCTRRGPGDFVVVCPNTDEAGMTRAGERFEQALSEAGLLTTASGTTQVAVVGFERSGLERGVFRSDDVFARLGAARERARNEPTPSVDS